MLSPSSIEMQNTEPRTRKASPLPPPKSRQREWELNPEDNGTPTHHNMRTCITLGPEQQVTWRERAQRSSYVWLACEELLIREVVLGCSTARASRNRHPASPEPKRKPTHYHLNLKERNIPQHILPSRHPSSRHHVSDDNKLRELVRIRPTVIFPLRSTALTSFSSFALLFAHHSTPLLHSFLLPRLNGSSQISNDRNPRPRHLPHSIAWANRHSNARDCILHSIIQLGVQSNGED